MNIDFANHAGFSIYVLLLMFSGAVMLFMASPVVRFERTFLRVLNTLFGFGFLAYGFYLAFLFQGGTYIIFFKAFILPALMVVNTIRASKQPTQPQAPLAALTYPGQPNPYAQHPHAAPVVEPSPYAPPTQP